jgi:hypothetical protein
MKNTGKLYQLRLFLKVVTLVLITLTGKAQTSKRDIVSQPIEWLSLNSNIKLNKYYGLTFDLQDRFVQDFNSMQHMVRIGAEVYITPKLSVVPIGYAYIWNYQYGKQPAAYVNNERRIWQHVAYKHHINRVAISHRLRLEERYLENNHKGEDGSVVNDGFTNVQTRLRYRLVTNIPLNHKKLDPKTIYISIWDEVFFSRGKAVTYHEADQNRLFVGPGYQITKKVAVQAGYFYQYLVKANGAKQENNSGPLLQLNYNFDFTKQ